MLFRSIGFFLLLFFLFSCKAKKEVIHSEVSESVSYSDTTILLQAVSDTFELNSFADTIIENKKGSSIEIKTIDSKPIIIYRTGEHELKLDSVIVWKKIKEVKNQIIYRSRCENRFHFFTIGFFFFSLILLVFILTIKSIVKH